MNYSEFYKAAKAELESAFTSMYAKGHPNNVAILKEALKEEPLVREPVFQTIFPWETSGIEFGKLSNLLGNDIINGLDQASFQDPLDSNASIEDMRFPKGRQPFAHQIKSWEAVLTHKKSIVVTTGTGSGKTECFMVPILKQLSDDKVAAAQQGKQIGIEAIFLYPLNALIASQRKRLHAWSKSLPAGRQVTYCNYNGELQAEEKNRQQLMVKAFPQLIDRKQLRDNPPQILLTNTSMIEYMMVRTADQDLKANSDLKWIVLDEAHTYNGSAATELALQIRRILKFFGKTPANVNFAICSATISNDPANRQRMQVFFEELTGKLWSDFELIEGQRIPPAIDYNHQNTIARLAGINAKHGLNLTPATIDAMRTAINTNPALELHEIANMAGITPYDMGKALCLVNDLSQIDTTAPVMTTKTSGPLGTDVLNPKETAFLPTRAHFNVRSISGVYACSNPNCVTFRNGIIGRLTTYKSATCPHCGHQLLEVVKCGQCGEFLLQGERYSQEQQIGQILPDKYKMCDSTFEDDSLIDFTGSEDDNESIGHSWLIGKDINTCPLPAPITLHPIHLNTSTSEILPASGSNDYIECIDNNGQFVCPNCGEGQESLKSLVFTPNTITQQLSRLLLDQSDSKPATNGIALVYEGKGYISFTDNRQKTANTARRLNVDVEREWGRASIYHLLVESITQAPSFTNQDAQDLANWESAYRLSPLPLIKNEIDKLKQKQQEAQLGIHKVVPKKWTDFEVAYRRDAQLNTLRSRLVRSSVNCNPSEYLQVIFLDQLGVRSLRSANSLETLGMVRLAYPCFDNISSVPDSFANYYGYASSSEPIAIQEWKNLLRVLLDITIRSNRHVLIPQNVNNILIHGFGSKPIYDWRFNRRQNEVVSTWPHYDRNTRGRIRREILMLLLAKGITDSNAITAFDETSINAILDEAWAYLTTNILEPTGRISDRNNNQFDGYVLNIFSNQVHFEFVKEAAVCPVTHQLLDASFRNISPYVKGALCPETASRYHVSLPTAIPILPIKGSDTKYRQQGYFDKKLWTTDVLDWIHTKYEPVMIPLIGDVNLQRNILQFRDITMSTEHSAQIDSKKLRLSEKEFTQGSLNILACSTTMEMGVDIGGLSVVSMNNVPPKPQNYLQRVGRAGRRSETQAMALTIYGDNPIGRNVEADPTWALNHPIEPSAMSFSSEIIIYRHVCAMLLGKYLETKRTNVTDSLGDFIMGVLYDPPQPPAPYSYNGFKGFLGQLINQSHPNYSIIENNTDELIHGTVLMGKKLDDLARYTDTHITTIGNDVLHRISSYQATMNTLSHSSKYYKKLKLALARLWKENLFGYLGKKNFLPNAYMPTDVTSFIISEKDHTSNPERELHLAISEYAPGNEVTVDEFIYPSVGVCMKGNFLSGQPQEEAVAKCDCGFVEKIDLSQAGPYYCLNCGKRLSPLFKNQAGYCTTSIEPVAFYGGEPKRHLNHTKKSGGYIQPVLLDMNPWPATISPNQCYVLRPSQGESSILYINKGQGYGFALCEWCGRMVPETGVFNVSNIHVPAELQVGHTNPETGRTCGHHTPKRNVIITAENKTNLTEIRILPHKNSLTPIEREQLLYTLGTIMTRQFAVMLGVEDGEIEFGLSSTDSIFIFDTHSGGSNYANQLSSQPLFEALLDNCLMALDSCCCTMACTHCLVDRRSQYYIEKLNRHLGVDWLKWELSNRNNIPSGLLSLFPSATRTYRISAPIEDAINTYLRVGNFNNANYYLTSIPIISSEIFDSIEHDMLLAKMLRGKNVALQVDSACVRRPSIQLLTELTLHSANYAINEVTYPYQQNFEPVLQTDNTLFCRYSDGTDVAYYQIESPIDFQLTNESPFNPRNALGNNHTYCNRITSSFETTKYLERILGSGKRDVDNYMSTKSNKAVDIEYTDIYILSPAVCILLCNTIKQMVEHYGLTINSLTIKTSSITPNNYPCVTINDSFQNQTDRDATLSAYCRSVLNINPNIVIGSLPHDRSLHFSNADFDFEIEANGGLGYGWKLEDAVDHSVIPDSLASPTDTFYMFNNKRHVGIKYTIGWKTN